MAELSTERARTLRRRAYLVQPEHDAGVIRETLGSRRVYAAYALGQLDPGLIGLTEWWTAKGDSGRALVLFGKGGLGEAMFCMGETEAVDAILRLHQGPRVTYATFQPEHLPAIKRWFIPAAETMMSRMVVTEQTFRPLPSSPTRPVRRLRDPDVRALNRLYGAEGGATYYNSAHVREGVYYGVTIDGELVAVAGTHVVGRSERIAVVGNVFTHPGHRGRGFAQAVTSAVTEALLRDCREVVLTVDPANLPAVRAYKRLGYEHACYLMEGAAVRKDPTGLVSFIRRRLAARRGRRHGGEMVLAPPEPAAGEPPAT